MKRMTQGSSRRLGERASTRSFDEPQRRSDRPERTYNRGVSSGVGGAADYYSRQTASSSVDPYAQMFSADPAAYGLTEDKDLYRTQPEMDSMVRTFNEMRIDAQLCDITFMVRGTAFPAHRVVLCSSSRWFRSLLSRPVEPEPIVLDQFEPKAFELVLGYLYGDKIEASADVSTRGRKGVGSFRGPAAKTLPNSAGSNPEAGVQPPDPTYEPCPSIPVMQVAKDILEVIHLLELKELEERYWKYLANHLDDENCLQIHYIADIFHCPRVRTVTALLARIGLCLCSLPPLSHANRSNHPALQPGLGPPSCPPLQFTTA